ncbi:helix-turn-helix domain-containing protein [Oculatella sp. LEGE 06141]|uniref:helix-turn-helix domain-containing protein n=1 Tax=Oculatella sp. LEGE 06141 TaxID=1828648 RepID=UPI001881EB9C|nr:helix-turn-helix domain-containing protein [Oculatella sp. LEGE 06141]MBE9178615.1 helix-turn-helix domain-containing protein [Oculatella sp. LEGE 06141]
MSQDDPRKQVAKQALLAGETIASIAQRLGVSRRTIERWADDGNWREQKVISINAKPKQSGILDSSPKKEPAPRRQRGGGDIDELEIIDLAISDLSATLSGGETDARSLGSIAGALVRLLEYRRKVMPKSAADLADMAIALDISPREFILTLQEKWQERA